MDPFTTLGLAADAPDEMVRRAFRRLALENHPDRNPGDTDAGIRFLRIKAAYDAIRSMRGERRRRPPEAPPRSDDGRKPANGQSGGRRTKEWGALENVGARLARLDAAIVRVLAMPAVTSSALEVLFEAARWTRVHVDLALAFRQHIRVLRDEAWASAGYTTAPEARAFLASFRAAARHLEPSRLDLDELRNLRVRLDGLKSVVDGWRRAVP